MGKKFSYKLVKEIIENEGYELLSDSYENIHKKLEIKCPNNHIFKMSFNNFKKGQRCKKCSSKNKYLVEEINEIANKNGFTLLNKEKEFNMRTAILLENEAGEISSMTLYSFENKYIHKEKNINPNYNNKKYTQEFVENMVEKRGCKLLNQYKGNKSKLKIQCPKGHVFEIRFDSFKKGSGCKECMRDSMKNDIDLVKMKLETRGFRLISRYEGSHEKITVMCNKGHIFDSTFDRLVNHKCDCPICKESKGEKKIRKFLDRNNIQYICQYRINECKCFKSLPFDFYLPEYNTCIEYDGIQHYEENKHFGGHEAFVERQKRDSIKTEYCLNNNIGLIRIPYWDFDNIEEILINELQLN